VPASTSASAGCFPQSSFAGCIDDHARGQAQVDSERGGIHDGEQYAAWVQTPADGHTSPAQAGRMSSVESSFPMFGVSGVFFQGSGLPQLPAVH